MGKLCAVFAVNTIVFQHIDNTLHVMMYNQNIQVFICKCIAHIQDMLIILECWESAISHILQCNPVLMKRYCNILLTIIAA